MSEQVSNLAFVFPGQGSQSLGMLSELAASHTEVKHVFEQASHVLDLDLWKMINEGPVDLLNQTQNTQPAMLAAGIATWNVWCQQTDIRPGWVAGHSLGEYTALVASGAILFEDAVKLVAERGRLMQQAVPDGVGAMAAILGLEDERVIQLCTEAANDEIVSAVNFNSPGQVVVAGNKSAVERVMVTAKDAGAKRALLLPVSVPSHCALMTNAAEKFDEYIQNIEVQSPAISLVHNVDVTAHSAAEVIKSVLIEQLYKPVRWAETIRFIQKQNVDTFVECGPGKVLMGLNKRITKEAKHMALLDPKTLDNVLESFK